MFTSKHATLLAGVTVLAALALPATADDFSLSVNVGNGGWHYRGGGERVYVTPRPWWSAAYPAYTRRAVVCDTVPARYYSSTCDVVPGRYYADYDYGPAVVYESSVPTVRHVARTYQRRTVYQTNRRYCVPSISLRYVDRDRDRDRDHRHRSYVTPRLEYRSRDAVRHHSGRRDTGRHHGRSQRPTVRWRR